MEPFRPIFPLPSYYCPQGTRLCIQFVHHLGGGGGGTLVSFPVPFPDSGPRSFLRDTPVSGPMSLLGMYPTLWFNVLSRGYLTFWSYVPSGGGGVPEGQAPPSQDFLIDIVCPKRSHRRHDIYVSQIISNRYCAAVRPGMGFQVTTTQLFI